MILLTEVSPVFILVGLVNDVRIGSIESGAGKIVWSPVELPIAVFQGKDIALDPRRVIARCGKRKSNIVAESPVGIPVLEAPFGKSLSHTKHKSVII